MINKYIIWALVLFVKLNYFSQDILMNTICSYSSINDSIQKINFTYENDSDDTLYFGRIGNELDDEILNFRVNFRHSKSKLMKVNLNDHNNLGISFYSGSNKTFPYTVQKILPHSKMILNIVTTLDYLNKSSFKGKIYFKFILRNRTEDYEKYFHKNFNENDFNNMNEKLLEFVFKMRKNKWSYSFEQIK